MKTKSRCVIGSDGKHYYFDSNNNRISKEKAGKVRCVSPVKSPRRKPKSRCVVGSDGKHYYFDSNNKRISKEKSGKVKCVSVAKSPRNTVSKSRCVVGSDGKHYYFDSNNNRISKEKAGKVKCVSVAKSPRRKPAKSPRNTVSKSRCVIGSDGKHYYFDSNNNRISKEKAGKVKCVSVAKSPRRKPVKSPRNTVSKSRCVIGSDGKHYYFDSNNKRISKEKAGNVKCVSVAKSPRRKPVKSPRNTVSKSRCVVGSDGKHYYFDSNNKRISKEKSGNVECVSSGKSKKSKKVKSGAVLTNKDMKEYDESIRVFYTSLYS